MKSSEFRESKNLRLLLLASYNWIFFYAATQPPATPPRLLPAATPRLPKATPGSAAPLPAPLSSRGSLHEAAVMHEGRQQEAREDEHVEDSMTIIYPFLKMFLNYCNMKVPSICLEFPTRHGSS